MNTIKKIKVTPKEGLRVNFEGQRRPIPKEGAEVVDSLYYRKMILEGSLCTTEPDKKAKAGAKAEKNSDK